MMRMVMTKANDDGDKYGDDEGSDYGEGDDGNNQIPVCTQHSLC